MKILLTKDTKFDPKLFGEYVLQVGNIIWSSKEVDGLKLDFNEAMKWAKENNVSFPTKQEIEKIIILNKLFPIFNLKQDFWSASVYSDNRRYAWIFYGNYGYVSVDVRDVSVSVRCVGQLSKE